MPDTLLAIERIRHDTEVAAAAVHAANRRWTLLEHLNDLYRRPAAHYLPLDEARELQSLAADEYGLALQVEALPASDHRRAQARVWLPAED